MNKEKYSKIAKEEFNKVPLWEDAPETWPEFKKVVLNFIDNMDEATEVYNMENKGE